MASESSAPSADSPSSVVVVEKPMAPAPAAAAAEVAAKPAPAAKAKAPSTPEEIAALQATVDYTVLSPLAYRAVFATLMLMCFMVGLDITIIVTAMPKIGRQFDCMSDISWTVTAFLLAQTAVSPLVGRLAEAFNRRAVVMAAVLLFTVFSLACALAQNFAQLAVFRALQGLGGGLIMPIVFIVVSDITPIATRGVAVAPIMMMFTLSSIVGPLLGGALTDIGDDGWRICFWSEERQPAAGAARGSRPNSPFATLPTLPSLSPLSQRPDRRHCHGRRVVLHPRLARLARAQV